jgi:hypothetical protein
MSSPELVSSEIHVYTFFLHINIDVKYYILYICRFRELPLIVNVIST